MPSTPPIALHEPNVFPSPVTADETGSARVAMWACIAGVMLLGLIGVYPVLHEFWLVWTGDPLRSLGMLLLPVSVVLVARVWKEHGWELRGSWWGVVPIALSYLSSFFLTKNFDVKLTIGFTISLLPMALTVCLYGCGVVLLFAGVRVLKAAWFPLLLLLLLNPLPSTFVSHIDLPLQTAAATVARAFATMLHFRPTTPQLTLMFSPRYGMFIAPGCDGVRGAVTLGYMALIAGFLKKLDWKRWALFTLGAVALGYVLNFVRLCLLVVYYRVTLGDSAWENRAKMGDYVIGGTLCLIATFLFFSVFLQMNRGKKPKPALVAPEPRSWTWAKIAVCGMMLVLPLFGYSKAVIAGEAAEPSAESFASLMPRQVGEYTLTRTWREMAGGTIMLQDAAYAKVGVPGEVIFGVWIPRNQHDSLDCWRIRGEKPEIVASPMMHSADGQDVRFDSALFDDGIEATALWTSRCTPWKCSDVRDLGNEKIGLRIFKPDAMHVYSHGGRPIFSLIRIASVHTGEPAAETYAKLSEQAREFTAAMNFSQLSARFQ